MKKRLITIFLAILCIVTFTGCSVDEISLISAMEKDMQMTSVKTTESLSGNMKITLPEEIKEEMGVNLQSILNMLSSFRLEATTLQQMKGNTATAKSNFSIVSEDLCFDSEIYASVADGNVKSIIKIPSVAKVLLPERYEDAVYLSIDTADMEQMIEKQLELEQLQAEYYGYDYTPVEMPVSTNPNTLSSARTLSDHMFQAFKDYAAQMKDTPKIVTKSGKNYSVMITDETFKELLSSLVLTYFDEPEARETVSRLWDAFSDYYSSIYPTQTTETIFPPLPELPQDPMQAANLRAQAELILNVLKPVRLIGEEGIRINFTLNSKGFITELDTAIHLDFDINAITELMSGYRYEEDFAFEIRLQYNQKRQNINGIYQIPFPTLTEENNLPFYQLMTETLEDQINHIKNRLENGETFWDEPEEESLDLPAADGSISIVLDYGDWQELMNLGEDVTVINENGTLYVPLEPWLDYFGLDYDWNGETGYVLFQNPYNYNWMWFCPGERVICCDDYDMTLSAPTLIKDGQTYLPLRAFVSAFTDYRISWSQEENAAYLTPWYYLD